jgi:hypothetical protein
MLAKYPGEASKEQLIQSMRQVGDFLLVPRLVDALVQREDFDLKLEFHLGLLFLTVCLDSCAHLWGQEDKVTTGR